MSQSEKWEKVFEHACEFLFSKLNKEEVLNINFSAEESFFTRLNKSLVRQATSVVQASVSLDLIVGSRRSVSVLEISENQKNNEVLLASSLSALQKIVPSLPEDPYISEIKDNGVSRLVHSGSFPNESEFLDIIHPYIKNVDLAGILSGGETCKGSANSLGQKHWFSSMNFYLDYSLYTAKERAVKGIYGGTNFDSEEFKKNIQESIRSLEVMDREKTIKNPGKYKCYFAPAAVAEIFSILSWGGLSGASYKQGVFPFTKEYEGKEKLSDQFSLSEDFSLGLSPRFNELGEVAPEKMEIFHRGELKNLLVSSSTEKEYDLKSNQASMQESPRSLIMATGTLSRENILKELGEGFYISNLHYLNWSDRAKGRITGMTRFGCLWIENGEVMGPIKDMRFDETLKQIFGKGLLAVTDFAETMLDTGSYSERSLGGLRVPGVLVKDFHFTL